MTTLIVTLVGIFQILLGWALWLRHKRWILTERHQHEVTLAELKVNEQSVEIEVIKAKSAKTLAEARLKRLDTAHGLLPRWSSDKPLGNDKLERILKIVEEEVA
jgi:hypothetical protein